MQIAFFRISTFRIELKSILKVLHWSICSACNHHFVAMQVSIYESSVLHNLINVMLFIALEWLQLLLILYSNRTDTIPVITLIYSNRTVINLVAGIYTLLELC